MQKPNFQNIVRTILKHENRYDVRAYNFVREGLDYTMKSLKRNSKNGHNHVSGAELLEGLRKFTLNEFGPMGKTVLNEWGINRCEDFGHIVFHLVNQGVLGKSDSDSLKDFSEIWSFDEAFVDPFKPAEDVSFQLREDKSLKSHRISPANQKAETEAEADEPSAF